MKKNKQYDIKNTAEHKPTAQTSDAPSGQGGKNFARPKKGTHPSNQQRGKMPPKKANHATTLKVDAPTQKEPTQRVAKPDAIPHKNVQKNKKGAHNHKNAPSVKKTPPATQVSGVTPVAQTKLPSSFKKVTKRTTTSPAVTVDPTKPDKQKKKNLTVLLTALAVFLTVKRIKKKKEQEQRYYWG